jgi:non-specific serine/threonine protein kinase
MTVAPLSVPSTEPGPAGPHRTSDAVRLFVDRAQLVSPGFELTADNAATVGRLCTLLEGMPLAIELAAARLRVLSLQQMIERFEDRFALLSAGAAARAPRHQTLRASIDWSFELCSADEQAVWARMSVFEGGADLDTVEAVCGGPSLDVLEAVAGLVDKSVLAPQETAGRVRYRMLTSIRDYGRERLAMRGEAQELLVRHRDHYVALARTNAETWFGPGQRGRLSRVSSEIGNFRAALEASLVEPADPDSALELVGSLWWYWVAVGAMDRGMRFNDRVLSVELPASSLAMQALSKAAMLASLGNDAARLDRFAERVLAVEVTDPDDGARSARRRVTGLLHAFRLDLEPAIREDLRALSEEAQPDRLGPETTVEVLVQLSTRLAWGHRPADSLQRVDAAIELCRRHGEEWYLSYLLYLRGARLRSLRRYGEALDAARACLLLARGLNSLAIVSSIETVAQAFAGLGQGREAAVLYGALNGLWSGVGGSLYYGDEKAHARGQQRARELLPADEFKSAYDRGRAMTQEEVVAFVLGEPTGPRAATPPAEDLAGVDLTRRELEIAELIARGLSNKEIAESLVISPRTAEGHVARLLQKLGFQSRALVATWVAERRVLGA